MKNVIMAPTNTEIYPENEQDLQETHSYANISNIANIIRFDNSRGHNNCWLNCVVRVLAHMLELVPEENVFQQTENPMVDSFLQYLKKIIMMKNGGELTL